MRVYGGGLPVPCDSAKKNISGTYRRLVVGLFVAPPDLGNRLVIAVEPIPLCLYRFGSGHLGLPCDRCDHRACQRLVGAAHT